MKKWLYPMAVLSIAAFLSGLSLTVLSGTGEETRAEEAPKAEEAKAEAPAKGEEHAATAAEEEAPKAESKTKRILSSKYQGCLTDEVALKEIERARQELAQKSKALEARVAELDSREKALKDELAKLDDIQKQIKSSQDQLDAKDEEKIAKLVETFESMSPKAAAQIVAGLDQKLAVKAMSRVTPQKLGKILSAMKPEKSSELTEALAGPVRAKSVEPASVNAAAIGNAGKAGESKNANNDKLSTNESDFVGDGGGRQPASNQKVRTPAIGGKEGN